MNWPTHPAYKSSGVQWLGEVPAHWGLSPMFTVGHERTVPNTGLSETNLLSLSYGRIVRKDIDTTDGLLPASFDTYQIVGPFDIVFRFTDLQNDKRSLRSALVPERGIITSAYLAFSPTQIDPRYFSYLMRSYDLTKVFYSRGGGLRQSLKYEDVKRLPILVPPTNEQRVISRFLDRETAKIDVLIAKQEQLIATLREDRAATITQAVTEGLDPDVEMSTSGTQVLPAHWTNAVPLKRLAEVQTGLTLGRSVRPESAITLPYLRVANVQVGRVDLSTVTEVEVDRSEVARYQLQAGDVLMTEGGDIDKLGRGCLWQGEIDPCLHQNHVFAVRCSDGLDARFLVYLLDTVPAREYFMLTAKKTTNLASTNSTTLGRFSFAVPPIAEQATIVKHLDERCSKIDSLIGRSTEMIETLREYRSALITNAVTGKIDVRKAV